MKTLMKRRPKLTPHNVVSSPSGYEEIPQPAPAVPDRLALIDSQGTIVAVNNDWIALARETGTALNRVGPGTNYFEVCRKATDSGGDSHRALNGIRVVLTQRAPSFAMDYACPTSSGTATFHMAVSPIAYGDARAAISHTEVKNVPSDAKTVGLLQQFARRLINAQEEERQRISREIHDDLGNRIALMALSIRQIIKQSPENSSWSTSELNKVIDQIADLSTAMRDLSHGLHPPLLRHVGIKAALKSLRDSFERTHGIATELVGVAELPKIPDEMALCIFRVTQESLQNIAKHADADKVTIVFDQTPRQIRLTVSDTGRGFVRSDVAQKGGLGLLSMEARARGIGGHLSVDSSPRAGTEVRLTIPLRNAASMVTVR
jgi:signal transduction histidine kinase